MPHDRAVITDTLRLAISFIYASHIAAASRRHGTPCQASAFSATPPADAGFCDFAAD